MISKEIASLRSQLPLTAGVFESEAHQTLYSLTRDVTMRLFLRSSSQLPSDDEQKYV